MHLFTDISYFGNCVHCAHWSELLQTRLPASCPAPSLQNNPPILSTSTSLHMLRQTLSSQAGWLFLFHLAIIFLFTCARMNEGELSLSPPVLLSPKFLWWATGWSKYLCPVGSLSHVAHYREERQGLGFVTQVSGNFHSSAACLASITSAAGGLWTGSGTSPSWEKQPDAASHPPSVA